ncbi:hypothetical protein DM992_25205 [Burkholderia sp. JP2-270]|nr:hypothetical protein DM992_25205 [Burkholderia sp. JP2-270]
MYFRPDVSGTRRIISLWRHATTGCPGKPCPISRAGRMAVTSPDGDVFCRIVRHGPARPRRSPSDPCPAAQSGRWHETCTNLSRSAAHRAIEQQPKPLGDSPCLS